MEITNGQPWQNSSQNSVFLKGAKCHFQVAEFLPHKYKRMIKSKYPVPVNILPGNRNSGIPRSSFYSQISVYGTPAKRARENLLFLSMSSFSLIFPCFPPPHPTSLDANL
jgi:hypothetical protein